MKREEKVREDIKETGVGSWFCGLKRISFRFCLRGSLGLGCPGAPAALENTSPGFYRFYSIFKILNSFYYSYYYLFNSYYYL